MIAVIFEVWIEPKRQQDYLAIAARLKPELEKMDGFIAIERFQSLSDKRKLLSLSLWRDEDAVCAWRNHAEHRQAQRAGRESIFSDYRLRVVSVLRDYGMNDRAQAPQE
jgi:heme-degrading monooxygenase HmoA